MDSVYAMPPAKLNFPGPIGTKRRRMRSGGGVSTLTNNTPKVMESHPEEPDMADPPPQEKKGKCKLATTIPIFLKKTYKMIDTCDASIASWTPDGDMFVVKDPDVFATSIIPQYFDHNKFSSFARQLNFYGFRKMQSKPIRNSDFDANTAKHVTFYNENFKRGRCDLLKKIQRSTRGGGSSTTNDSAREVQNLREQVQALEQKVADLTTRQEERMRRLELDMLGRLEQVMMAMQQSQNASFGLQATTSIGSNNSSGGSHGSQTVVTSGNGVMQQPQQAWDQSVLPYPRGNSVNSMGYQQVPQQQQPRQTIPMQENKNMAPPTLPPHPKQKQLPAVSFPSAIGAPPDRFNSLRGISTLSRGLSGLSRGASIESNASAVLMRNSWEDKFFSMLMLDSEGNGPEPTPMAPGIQAPVTVSDRSASQTMPAADDDLSSVSTSDMP